MKEFEELSIFVKNAIKTVDRKGLCQHIKAKGMYDSIMSISSSFKESIFRLEHNIINVPKCKYCNKEYCSRRESLNE